MAYPNQFRILITLIIIFTFTAGLLFSLNEQTSLFLHLFGATILGILLLCCVYSTMFAIITRRTKWGKKFIILLWLVFFFLFAFTWDDNLFITLAYIMLLGGVSAAGMLVISWLLDTEKRRIYRGR